MEILSNKKQERILNNNENFQLAFDFAFKEIDPDVSKLESSKRLLKNRFPEINSSSFDLDDVKRVYYERIWVESKFGLIKNQRVARKLFDFACNLDSKRSVILVQRSLNAAWDSKLIVDGKMGKKTIDEINHVEEQGNSDILEKLICHYAANFYEIFGDRDHIKYLLQWVFR